MKQVLVDTMVRYTLFISEEMDCKIRELAKARQVPKAVIFREALEKYCNPSVRDH